MQPENALLLSEAVFWLLIIISAPFVGRVAYTLSLPLWYRIFRSPYIELTFKQGNRELKFIVNRNDDYIEDVEKALKKRGFE